MNHIVKSATPPVGDMAASVAIADAVALRATLAQRLADPRPSLDGEAVFAELRARHASQFRKE